MNTSTPEFMTQHDDTWIPSSCALCYGTCSILVHPAGRGNQAWLSRPYPLAMKDG